MSHAQTQAAATHREPNSVTLLGWIALARAAHRQRRALAALTSERLKDLGVSPEAAAAEAAKPVWNVPHHWLR
jgi:uncharacterized protein YjiS (DUF1127 family)